MKRLSPDRAMAMLREFGGTIDAESRKTRNGQRWQRAQTACADAIANLTTADAWNSR